MAGSFISQQGKLHHKKRGQKDLTIYQPSQRKWAVENSRGDAGRAEKSRRKSKTQHFISWQCFCQTVLLFRNIKLVEIENGDSRVCFLTPGPPLLSHHTYTIAASKYTIRAIPNKAVANYRLSLQARLICTSFEVYHAAIIPLCCIISHSSVEK